MELHNRFDPSEFTLRDYLALERTIMSNERTLLAYFRTGLALTVAGVTGLHYLQRSMEQWICVVVLCAGILTTLIGTLRFASIKKRLDLASPAETANSTASEISEFESKQ